MRYLALLFAITLTLSASAQYATVKINAERDSGMAYVQGYEYNDGCEFVFKDSCRIERGCGELNFTMDDDTDVTIMLVTDKQRSMHRLTIGPSDTVTLNYSAGNMTISEDRRQFREQYARFQDIKASYANKLELYYTEFPSIVLNDPELSQSSYLVHNAIAIRSIARAPLEELDSLRTTFQERLPHARSFTVHGDKHTERSRRDRDRFSEILLILQNR